MANLKASIDFGLVHIPVELIVAEDRSERVSFHLLDSRDESRIRFKRVNENTGEEVEWEDIVKGYEIEDEKYIVFTDEELNALESESNKSLLIDAFIEKDEIPPEMFEMPYYVVPTKGGERAYAILQQVLEKTGKFAVVQAVLRTKEQLGTLYGRDGAILYAVLRYPDELKPASGVVPSSLSKLKVSPKEVAVAEKLLEQMTSKFNPSQYKDDYISKLRTAIRQKSGKGKRKLAPTKEKKTSTKTIDIMELLQKSLKKQGNTSRQGRSKRHRAAA